MDFQLSRGQDHPYCYSEYRVENVHHLCRSQRLLLFPCFVLSFPETKGKSLEEVDLLFIREGSDAAAVVAEKHRVDHIENVEQGSAGSGSGAENEKM